MNAARDDRVRPQGRLGDNNRAPLGIWRAVR
jgi:hypothetical protein